jgi:hypothetical protein
MTVGVAGEEHQQQLAVPGLLPPPAAQARLQLVERRPHCDQAAPGLDAHVFPGDPAHLLQGLGQLAGVLLGEAQVWPAAITEVVADQQCCPPDARLGWRRGRQAEAHRHRHGHRAGAAREPP